MGLPTDSTHLTRLAPADLVPEFTQMVDTQFAAQSVMRQFFPVRRVVGTNSAFVRRMGTTVLQAVRPGVRPDATPTYTGKVSVTVDTLVLARNNEAILDSFQRDFDIRSELAMDQGKQLGKLFDQSFLIQAIKGAGMAAPTGTGGTSLGGAIGAGHDVQFTAAGDENDPDKLYDAITSIITEMKEAEQDTSDIVVFVRPTVFKVLLDNDKLVSSEFSTGNGDFARAMLYKIFGCRLFETARIPSAAITGHLLSNADNGNAYDVTADEAKTVAVVCTPSALLAGETIPLTSNIWFSDEEKQFFIDSWMSYGVTVRRPDCCGRVRKA